MRHTHDFPVAGIIFLHGLVGGMFVGSALKFGDWHRAVVGVMFFISAGAWSYLGRAF